MTIQDLKEMKAASGFSDEQIADMSGLPLHTVKAAFADIVDSVSYDTLMAIMKVFRQTGNCLKESSVPYRVKQDGEYTVEDYHALPDECRVELIDGTFFTMEAPSTVHQILLTAVWRPLDAYIRKNKGRCLAMLAPVDVQLDEDDKTMMQPDIMVLCDRDRLRKKGIWGAPDFVAEIASPSTRRHDSVRKLAKYRAAGVREYWIIDPDRMKITVYDFEDGNVPVLYGFDVQIPVGIFGGDCRIDFSQVYEEIRFLYERPGQ